MLSIIRNTVHNVTLNQIKSKEYHDTQVFKTDIYLSQLKLISNAFATLRNIKLLKMLLRIQTMITSFQEHLKNTSYQMTELIRMTYSFKHLLNKILMELK